MDIIFWSESQNNVQINLSDIFLSNHNPRYTLWKFDEKQEQYLVDDSINKEESAIRQLFISEGYLNEFIDLLESIKTYGFQNDKRDPIILIRVNHKENKFVVAEGNRRIMALKFIINPSLLPSLETIKTNILPKEKQESLLDNNFENNPLTNEKDVYPKNYNRVKNLIEELNKNSYKYKVYYEIENDYFSLVKSIYSKHVTGERLGLRRWPRSKYYADLLSLFPNGINVNNHKTNDILSNFQRKISDIINDYKQAQYVYKSFFYQLTDEDSEYILNNDYVLKEMINSKGGVSALEKSHSFNKFKKTVMNLKNLTSKEFDDEYISFSSSEEDYYLIKTCERKLKEKDLFKFIYNEWFYGTLNTRELGSKQEDFEYKVNLFLESNKISTDTLFNLKQLRNINEFEVPEYKRSDFIKINKQRFPEEMRRFEIADRISKTKKEMNDLLNLPFIKEYQEYSKKLSEIDCLDPEDLNGIKPIFVFYILLKQYADTKQIYLNSLASTIRAFIEQFVIWISDIHNKRIIDEDLEIKSIKNFNRNYEVEQELRGDNISAYDISSGELMQKRVKTFLDNCRDQKIGVEEVINTIKSVYISEYKETATNDFSFLLNTYWGEKKDGENDHVILCEFIHANHRIYIQPEYIKNLELFEKYQKFVFDIYKKIDWDKLLNTDQYIAKHVHKNN